MVFSETFYTFFGQTTTNLEKTKGDQEMAKSTESDRRDLEVTAACSRLVSVPLFNSTMETSHLTASYLMSRGGGGTPLYGLYRYVRPQRVWFFSRFGHK